MHWWVHAAHVADDGEGGGGDGGAAQEGEVTHGGAEGAPGQGEGEGEG